MKRRDFLKGGTLLAVCLVAGLKPTEPKIIKSPVVDLKGFCKAVWIFAGDNHINFVQEPRWPALYGGMAGGGKTPDSFADFEYYWINERVAVSYEINEARPDEGFLVPPYMMGDLLDAVRHAA